MHMTMNNANTSTAVVRGSGAFHLIAAEPIAAGSRLFRIEGQPTHRASFTSVQIESNLHIDIDPMVPLLEQMDQYPWRFMNHSCAPNTQVRGRQVLAILDVRPGEELTFNYNTTEWDMAEPFVCRCASPRCAGTVQGYRHLSQSERHRLRDLAAPHLTRLPGDEPSPAVEGSGAALPVF